MARFVPLLSTIGVFRLLGVSFGQRVESLAPSVQRYAQATRFRATGYRAAADEVMHIGETVSEIRNTRRKLTIPVLVVTGARGADENWRRLQQDESSLSERGCLITAEQSGHVIPIDQPAVVVDAIRTVVEIARGHDVPLCSTLAANGPGSERSISLAPIRSLLSHASDRSVRQGLAADAWYHRSPLPCPCPPLAVPQTSRFHNRFPVAEDRGT